MATVGAITRFNRGGKRLQTSLTKPFFNDRYVLFTKILSSSVLLWSVLKTFSSICFHKLKSKGLKSGDRGGKVFGPKAPVGVQTIPSQPLKSMLVLRPVRRRNLIFLTHGRTFVSKISL